MRIFVDAGGCSGFTYNFDIISGKDIEKDNDYIFNAAAEDDHSWITDSKRWIDYTELPDSGKVQTGNVEIKTDNIGLFTEDELVAKGYQLTDTGWVKA